MPDDWDLESTASLNSDLQRLDQNIKTISEMISNGKDLQLYQIEPKAPGRIITCFFSTCYFTLGKVSQSVSQSVSVKTIYRKSKLNVRK